MDDYYPCRRTMSAIPTTTRTPMCKLPQTGNPALEDESFLGKKDHLYFNARCGRCSWSPRYDDKFWNTRYGAPVYTTRFDAPSPVKPPWCPPSCKTRSYLYPRYYKRNKDGFYPDECRPRCNYQVKNPTGTNSTGAGSEYCRKWTIPLCPCPLAGRSRSFPSPKCCGCAPSPACVPKKLVPSNNSILDDDLQDQPPVCTVQKRPSISRTSPLKCFRRPSFNTKTVAPYQCQENQPDESLQPINVIAVIDEKSWSRIRNMLGNLGNQNNNCNNDYEQQQPNRYNQCEQYNPQSNCNDITDTNNVTYSSCNGNNCNPKAGFEITYGNWQWSCDNNGRDSQIDIEINPQNLDNCCSSDEKNNCEKYDYRNDEEQIAYNSYGYDGNECRPPRSNFPKIPMSIRKGCGRINRFLTRSCILRRNNGSKSLLPPPRRITSANNCRKALDVSSFTFMSNDEARIRTRDPWR